jgi:hypothetical protein
MMLIHVFLDNARYHHAKLVQQWLARIFSPRSVNAVNPIFSLNS